MTNLGNTLTMRIGELASQEIRNVAADLDAFGGRLEASMEGLHAAVQDVHAVVQDVQADMAKLLQLQLQQLKLARRRAPVKVHQYDEKELRATTLNFSVKIGQGGFGDVFRGAIDAAAVAVKVLRPEVVNKDRQLSKEAIVLWGLRHPHIVSILGCCPGPNKVRGWACNKVKY
jgi:hypothetical protein